MPRNWWDFKTSWYAFIILIILWTLTCHAFCDYVWSYIQVLQFRISLILWHNKGILLYKIFFLTLLSLPVLKLLLNFLDQTECCVQIWWWCREFSRLLYVSTTVGSTINKKAYFNACSKFIITLWKSGKRRSHKVTATKYLRENEKIKNGKWLLSALQCTLSLMLIKYTVNTLKIMSEEFQILLLLLLIGSIQSRAVHPLPNTKNVYLLPCLINIKGKPGKVKC